VTSAPTYRRILALVWPLALGMVNNALMQFADRVYLAHHSMEALEAVLPANVLVWVFFGFFQSIVGYAGVFVAQYHGAGNPSACVKSYRAGLVIALAAGALVWPLIPFGDAVFRWTAASPALAALESVYYDIALAGGVFLFLQMAASAYFTGRGRTRIVFWVNLGGNALNVLLDPVLIFGWWGAPALGVAGAAWATVASQVAQCIVLGCCAERDVRRTRKRADGESISSLLLRMLRFGVPAGGYEILNMLSFTVFVFVTGREDGLAFAVSNACFSVNYLLFAPMIGFSVGAQTLVGQYCGKGDPSGAACSFRRTLLLALLFVIALSSVILVFNGPVLSLFAPEDAVTHEAFTSLGVKLFALMAAWLVFDAADTVVAGALKGAGDTKFVFWWTFLCSFVLWLPAVFAVHAFGGDMVALWSTLIAYVLVMCVGTLFRWRLGRWKQVKLIS